MARVIPFKPEPPIRYEYRGALVWRAAPASYRVSIGGSVLGVRPVTLHAALRYVDGLHEGEVDGIHD